MAEKKPGATYDAIMRDLKARNFAPIYILMGDESYYIDKIADYIAEHVLEPDDRDFNQTVLFGADIEVEQIVSEAKGYPIMPAEHRVIIVKEAQGLKNLEALDAYCAKPVPSTILVLCYKNGSIDRRKKFMARTETTGVVFESKKKKDYELPKFIEAYLKAQEASIDPKSASMIAEHIGSDLNRLTSELDKLLIALHGDDRRVTPELVEKQIGISKDFNAFELRDAIINRDVFKANQIVNYFDKNPKASSLYSIVPLLFSYFQMLMIAHYAPNKTNERELAAFLELKSVWSVRSYVTGLRNYSAKKTLLIISKLREIDGKSKGIDSKNTPEGDLMRELIFFILH